MKVFESEIANTGYFLYRLLCPIIDPIKLVQGVLGYFWFFRDFLQYKSKAPNAHLLNRNIFPILNEKTSHPFDSHYYYQELWAFQHILKNKPTHHVDIASKLQFSGFVASITSCDYVDIRALKIQQKNLHFISGSVLSLPYKDNSLESVSTLHVIEHIGLGRYGDPIDPEGTRKAGKELIRVLKPGGKLYVSVPTGKYRICFNAHRVHTPEQFIAFFNGLRLLDFSVVDDTGIYHGHQNYRNYSNLNYGCGMYLFTKTK